jgi:hypothetical protein
VSILENEIYYEGSGAADKLDTWKGNMSTKTEFREHILLIA